MRAVRPYRTVAGAKQALDNGGRFFNLLSRAGDEQVSAGELSRAAGVHSIGTRAFLFLDMALSELPEEDRTEVISLLAPKLRTKYEAAAAPVVTPPEVDGLRKPGKSVIAEGHLTYRDEKQALTGMILVPAGKAMVPVPIYERYRLYDISDSPDGESSPVLVATPKASQDLADRRVRLGGEFKAIAFQQGKKSENSLFLEGLYYTFL